MSTDEFRAKLAQDLKEFVEGPVDPDLQEWFERHVYYMTAEFGDASTYQKLKDMLQQVDKDNHPRNYFYYLATAPDFFGPIVRAAGRDRV